MPERARDSGILMSALSQSAKEALLSRGQAHHWAPGQIIFAREEPGDSMIVLRTGRVTVSVTDPHGHVSVLDFMGPGEVVGEITLLDGRARTADVVAATDVTGIIIDRRAVLDVVLNDADATIGVIAELCAKVRNASTMFETQAVFSGPERLARCLLRLSVKWGEAEESGGTAIGGGFSQNELGAYAGLSRESVNRTLRRWIKDGLVHISQTDKRIVVDDRARLLKIARQESPKSLK